VSESFSHNYGKIFGMRRDQGHIRILEQLLLGVSQNLSHHFDLMIKPKIMDLLS
jgi:hypothetical protein